MKQLTKIQLKQMLSKLNRQGCVRKHWTIKDEAYVFVMKDVDEDYPVNTVFDLMKKNAQHASLIVTITKDFKLLEVRVIDNGMHSDEKHNADVHKWEEIFKTALTELQPECT